MSTRCDLFASSDDAYKKESISSVYSLAVQQEALWLLSGLESGAINLQSVRHDEGKRITWLRGHTSAVSSLSLAPDEKSFLSGSWDKTILEWDLTKGKTNRSFEGSTGQISALERRPVSSLPVSQPSEEAQSKDVHIQSDSADEPRVQSTIFTEDEENKQGPTAPGSPAGSLFDADSLFGNDENIGEANVVFDDDDDNDFSRAIASELQEASLEQPETQGDVATQDVLTNEPSNATKARVVEETASCNQSPLSIKNSIQADEPPSQGESTKSLPHSDETTEPKNHHALSQSSEARIDSDYVFLAASFDGSLRIWDRRQQGPVAAMMPHNVPPWCMGACFSADGNFIYAGRRNSTIDEYSLHTSLHRPSRNFKLPSNSGPVSALRAMPNGRHLIWLARHLIV